MNQQNIYRLYTDGASRKNPGPAGAGVYVDKNGELYLQQGFYLNHKTNNQAEYLALLIGLFLLQDVLTQEDKLIVISDSQLLVRQLQGKYRVKNEGLRPLFELARVYIRTYNATLEHVLREYNVAADMMANEGVDKRIPLLADCHAWLKEHHIYI